MLSRRRLISEHGGDAVRITNTTCGAHPGKAGATNVSIAIRQAIEILICA